MYPVIVVRFLPVLACTLIGSLAVEPHTTPAGQSSPASQQTQGPVFISEPPNRVTFLSTKGALIPCTAYARPAPAMDWVKADGSDVSDIPGLLEILTNNSLYFHPFSEQDFRVDVHTGSFRCMASNSGGVIISRKVTIQAVLPTRYRTYNVRVNDIYVTRGNTAVFRCAIDPYYVRDLVHVTSWTQNGKTIHADDRTSVLPSGELLIGDIRTEDSYVQYRCVTTNTLTGDQRTSDPATPYVIEPVNSAPSLHDLPKVVKVEQGQLAELPCVASSYPLPTYTWSKDDVIITSTQARVERKGGNLLLKTALVRDSGRYRCTTTNPLGTQFVHIDLVVTAPLSAYIEPIRQTVDVGRMAMFNCTVYGHPVGGVQWYKDGRPLVVNNRVSMVTEHSLRILSVEREDRGMYQCTAWNDNDNVQTASQLSLGVARPIVFRGFEDKTVAEGPGVSLQCVASGNPTPVIQWTLDDSPLPASRRYSIGSRPTDDGDVISYVNITNVRIKDGGQYKCTAVNAAGSSEHIGRLNVYGVPYIRPMANITAVAHEMLVLRCYVTGYPIDGITWIKDDHVLPVNHRQQVSADGILTIHNVSKDHDQGEYSCDARNSGGQGMSRSFYISVMEPPKIDSFQFPKRKQGDRVSVSCVVSSGDLPLSVEWQWNGQPIDPDTGVRIQKLDSYSSSLSINHVDPRHNGNYTCTARNKVATATHTAVLHVFLPPRWLMEPADSYAVLGSSVILDCQATGDPKPEITWKKSSGSSPGSYLAIDNEDATRQVSTEHHTQQLSNGSLFIRNINTTDKGYYLCEANNGVGAGLGKVIYLTVHVPARFEKRDHNYSVHLGEDVTIDCVVHGDTPLSVSWNFNGRSLDWQHTDRIDVSSVLSDTGRTIHMTVHRVQRQDSGFYICNAKNMFGSDSMTSYLKVFERPDAPEHLSVYTGSSREVTVHWAAAFNGNSPVTAYIVQAKRATGQWYDSDTINVTVAGTLTEATLTGLHPAFTYTIRIVAVNSIGLSDPSQPLSYTTHAEAPSGSPESLEAIATGSQSLVVTWKAPLPENQNGKILGYYIGYKIYNDSAPYMYLTRRVDQLKTTDDAFMTEDGKSPIFLESSEDGQRYIMAIEGLEKFTQYSVHVQAYNEQGAGPRTDDQIVFTLEDVPSQPPQNVQATPLSSQSIMVVWGPPPLYTLHGILQGYRVFYKPVRVDEDESDSISITTSKLSAAIFGLQTYTNYSIQVLAYTRKGEGVRSVPVYVRTQPDVPERPADVKVVPAGPGSVYVVWKSPLHPNGQLLKYTVYMRDVTELESAESTVDIPASQHSYLVTNLSRNHKYSFSVSANTVVGGGERTFEVTVATVDEVGARIASFPGEVYAHWHNDMLLQCLAVGEPAPVVTWKKRSQPITYDDRMQLMPNGSLLVKDIRGNDSANYTCRAENTFGADEITVTLIVQAPPRQPIITIAATTSSTIQVNWRSGSNGGSKIQGFIVSYKREHGMWQSETVGADKRTYTASDLRCGTTYSFKVQAYNRVGNGIVSDTITARTNGSTPIMPAQSLILDEINSTWITLDLGTWQTGGCPITFYDIHYQYWGDTVWHTVEAHIDPEQKIYHVDLRPATWYIVKVMAHNDAGATECLLKFSTITYEGYTIEPVRIVHRYRAHFYQKAAIMIPLCAVFVLTVVFTVGIVLYCRRRHHDYQYKGEEGQIKPYATFPKQVKPLNNEPRTKDKKRHSISELGDPDLDKLPPPPPEMLSLESKPPDPSQNQGVQRQSGTSDNSSNSENTLNSSGNINIIPTSLAYSGHTVDGMQSCSGNVPETRPKPVSHLQPSSAGNVKTNKRSRPPTPPPRSIATRCTPTGGSTDSTAPETARSQSAREPSSERNLSQESDTASSVHIPDVKTCLLPDQSTQTSSIATISGSQLLDQTYSTDQADVSPKESHSPGTDESVPLVQKLTERGEVKRGRSHRRYSHDRDDDDDDECTEPLQDLTSDDVC